MYIWSQLLEQSRHVAEDDFRRAHSSPVLVQRVDDPAMWSSNPGLLVPASGGTAAARGSPIDPVVFELVPPEGKERVVVGRSRTADLTIPLSRLSKHHAWFGWSALERKHFINDMGSKNGTVVRGTRLAANFATQLNDGDEVLLGPYSFVFHTPEGLYAALRREASLSDSQEDTRAALGAMKTDVLPITPLGRRALDSDLLDRDTASRRNEAVRSDDSKRSESATRTSDSGYEVVKRLGQGGMADVVLARRQGPGGFAKEMAVKRLLPEFASDRNFLDMFLQEARLAARINHPNVVQIYELGTEDGRYFIAMEYVLGWDLSTIIKRARRLERPLPLEVVCRTGADICAGLHAAHTCVDEEGRSLLIVHRDVSPHNVMVSMPGISKITDFGISKAADSVRRTRPGELKGKLVYMAPEQVDDTLGEVDPRTDVFATGLCLYEMLTFEAPFKRGSELLTIEAVLKADVPDVREKRPDVPEALARAISRALSREQADRPRSARDLQLELERVAQTLPEPATATRCSEWLSEMTAARVGDDGLPDPRHRTSSKVASLS